MVHSLPPFFTSFVKATDTIPLPQRFTYPFDYVPHPLCLLAAEELQNHLKDQNEWEHNFGLNEQTNGPVIGKMFGVLIVKTSLGKLGYLAAFSGKLAGGNHHNKFVPPVFDTLSKDCFLNEGMEALSKMSSKIKSLAESDAIANKESIEKLKVQRKNHSITLQNKLFDNYYFLNTKGKEKSLREIFKPTHHKNPPSGAGECAAPKLLQYAFQNNLTPISIAEFWWGLSPKSNQWKHQNFYPACKEKCEPILAHMLEGIELDPNPNN